MAVPSSGEITMLGLAREKVYDNYSSTSTPTAPYSLKDLATSGNSGGSGTSFESTNTNGKDTTGTVTTSAETNVSNNQFTMNGSISSYGGGGMNIVIPHKMSEFHGYDHDLATGPEKGFVFSTTQSTTSGLVIGGSGVTKIAVSGTATGNYSYTKSTGVTSSTTYYYRAYITNSAGTVYGAVETLTTSSGITLYGVTLKFGNRFSENTVCTSTNTVTVYSTETTAANVLANEPTIYANSSGGTEATGGWYSDGTKKARWASAGTGGSWTISQSDCSN
jgi:hypothetical protein